MAIIGNDGISYSFESEDLITELTQDIAEFGGDMKVFAIFKWQAGIKLYMDYDFIIEGMPLDATDLEDDRLVEIMKADKLLEKFKEQNEVF